MECKWYTILAQSWPCRLAFSFLLLVFFNPAKAQYGYSRADQKQIQRNRVVGAASYPDYNRAAFYKVGLFFENIYRKYKDTSINAAIRFYEASILSEGDIYEPSEKAAFQLGRIYESGLGVPVNYNKAAIYYLLSGERGRERLAHAVSNVCPADTALYSPLNAAVHMDSTVIRFHPFCQLQGTSTMHALSNVAAYAKANPHLKISFAIAAPKELITSYYEYWKRTVAYERICRQVREHLWGQGISPERIAHSYEESIFQSPVFTLTINIAEGKQ